VEQLKKIILENRKKPESGEATLEIIIQTAALTFKIDSNDITELSSSSTLSGWDSLNNLISLLN
jgi:hypothetical protein